MFLVFHFINNYAGSASLILEGGTVADLIP